MDLNLIWQAPLIVVIGTLLLRLAGRKTISQMTLAETVIMISFGTLLIQPVVQKGLWPTFLIGFILILTLIVIEFGQLKSDTIEKIFTGKAKTIIENGKVLEKNLTKTRMTVDQLEMILRKNNVTSIKDVDWATLEPNGQLGFTLKEGAQPVTKNDLQQLKHSIDQLLMSHGLTNPDETKNKNTSNKNNIFTEVKTKEHIYEPPKHLQ